MRRGAESWAAVNWTTPQGRQWFQDITGHRVEWNCRADNECSSAVAERLGGRW
ncbi:hypothetical protein NGF19_10485 [Streptomyces sp. RY43-2]|uniref:Uncharacterized protein n=1 Tax=Streptomyces macrolidinus TaxID=2952607 RepID=A0ABT0ZCA4_9ACTN|nr:hypothetical protein [Streptomyces macrolidinus]MCN9241211.1 hypothetical protein [Streptomyces macrolidinus]